MGEPEYVSTPLGAAALARPRQRIIIEGVRVSSTRSVAIAVDRYSDTTLADRMHYAGQITDRQHVAALRLYGLFLAAGLNSRTTGRVDALPGDEESVESPEDGEQDEDARVAYRRLLRDAGQLWGPILDALCHEYHPGARWLATAQDGLDWLGDLWGLER